MNEPSESAVRLGSLLSGLGRGAASELARDIGVSAAAISNWVRGTGKPNAINRRAIACRHPDVTVPGWDVVAENAA